MFFLVPDQEGPPSAPPPDFNVELDLDDAPFLDEPEPEPAAPPAQEENTAPVAMPEKASASGFKEKMRALRVRLLADKKRLLLAGGALVVILAVAVAVNLFLFGGTKKPEPEKAPQAEKATPAEPTRIVVPSTPKEEGAPPPPKFIVEWEPFWVPLKGSEGEIRFLVFQFSIPTDEPALNAELHARTVILRDAVYYFLKNKEFTPLLNKESTDTLRDDIVSVINEHVVTGKVTTLLFSNYYLTDS